MRQQVAAAGIAGLVAVGFSAAPSAQNKTPDTDASRDNMNQRLGMVHFATSCNETAQRRFDRAMRYQHSFWYKAAGEIYGEALKADPGCAIAYWGIALSLLNNPHGAIPVPNLPLGLAAIKNAQATGAKTQRERDFIDALAVMYVDYDKIPHAARVQSYLKAMEALAGRYPDDDEAQIFYAITLNVAASPADKTYANQFKGAAILEPIFARQPYHPGVAHYLIHLYDYPPIAAKGLPAALRYSKIAPNAPHAQHMPSHIFTRVGYWKESVAANLASVRAAKAEKETNEELHGEDYLVYAYLQLAEDKKAHAVIEQIEAATFPPDAFGAAFSLAAAPARYAVEREDWKAAASLEIRPSRFPHVVALTRFARALGAAHSGDVAAARAEVAKLAELRDQLRAAQNAYWAGQVDVQWQIANAWALHAEGKYPDALQAMNAAAEAEDKTEKAPVTPGPLAPARELYGFMLLDRGMGKEGLVQFETTAAKEPNRFNGYVGIAKAAQMLGDRIRAKGAYEKLLALASDADGDRRVLGEAKAYLANN